MVRRKEPVMKNNLNSWLDTAPSLKTEKGAMKRLEKFLDIIAQNDSKFMVYRKYDGTFVPLVIASSKDWAVGAYAHAGICVTN
jgi:hypothetical protein